MTAIYMSLAIFATTIQSVFKKKVNKKCAGLEYSIGAIIALFALAYFLIFSDGLTFTPKVLPYSFSFAFCYAMATVTCVLAIGCGSMALTNLALAYSKIVPILYSIIFLKEMLSAVQIIGVVCLLASFVFTYYKRDNSGISLKWAIYALLLFASNGMCMVLMQAQQVAFGDSMGNSFMVVSLIFAVLMLLAAAIIREGKGFFKAIRLGIGWCGLSGGSNGIANYFALICLARVPGSIYYPISSAGDLILTFIFSLVLFKEKLSRNQVIGFIFGVLSMVLINI